MLKDSKPVVGILMGSASDIDVLKISNESLVADSKLNQ
jgi:phosphoribosylcarboxyaminoimidazole (NCAIR) mutase